MKYADLPKLQFKYSEHTIDGHLLPMEMHLVHKAADDSLGVRWNVFIKPIAMSHKQIEEFDELFSGKEFPHGNHRPLQPLNGRTLLTDSKDLK